MKRGGSMAAGGFGALPTRLGGGFGGGFGTHHTSTLSYLAEPPSLSTVSDPNVVVLLKNILKKDSITKARALEDLVAHVQKSPEDIEDAVLDIWVQIYPRTSIDNSRRVRELSHNLQFELLKATRKRMERRLSGIVATWIAGVFDRDRGVARAANAGLTTFYDTPEKMNAFWRKCQAQILDFAVDAINETSDTLSDERSTTKDDAEAKYFRVVYASMCLIQGLLQRVPSEDLSKFESRYEDYFQGDNVWTNIEASDPSVRKAVCHLLFASIDRGLPYADTKQARTSFVSGGLRTNQAGTALEFVRALAKLTQAQPQIWTETQGKKSPVTRLRAFIAKGSQGSPARFWEQLDNLLQSIPEDGTTLKDASDLITSLQSGISHREEPRTNTSQAWKCYIDTAKRLLSNLQPNDQLQFASDHLFPLFERFLFSAPGSTVAIPLGPNAMGIFVEAHAALAQGGPDLQSALVEEWKRLAATFCANISGVLPEVSKDFKASQERLGEEGRRWFGLLGELKRADKEDVGLVAAVDGPSSKVIGQCLELLRNRNMKPYGAARVVEFALSTSQHIFEGELGQSCIDFLSQASTDNMLSLLESPSAESLLSSLRLVRTIPSHQSAATKLWEDWTKSILELPPSAARDTALIALVSSDDVSQSVQNSESLQSEILSKVHGVVKEATDSDDLLNTALKYHALSSTSFQSLANELLQILEDEPAKPVPSLKALEKLVRADPKLFVEDESIHTTLVRHLLHIESTQGSEGAAHATSIRLLLSGDARRTLPPVVNIIQQNLETAGPQCLSIETLTQQARDAFQGGTSHEEIYPSTNSFMQALLPFLQRPVDPSMAIMNTTGDTALLVEPAEDSSSPPPPRDSDGRSIPLRMALYVCHLLDADGDISALPVKFQVELLYLQALVVQLVSDQISLLSPGGVWASLESPAAMEQAEWLVSTSRSQLLTRVTSCSDWSTATENSSHIMPQLVNLLAEESAALTPTALYSSRVLAEIFQAVVEKVGVPSAWEEKFLSGDVLKTTPNTVLLAAAALSGFGETLRPLKSVNTLCNRLVSNVAGAKASSEKTPLILALLALCGSVYDDGVLPIPTNRVVFAVKQVTDWLEDVDDMSPGFASGCLRCLAQLLPCVQEVYGSHWEKTLQFCVAAWEKAHRYPLNEVLPLLHASLRLTRTLQEMSGTDDDANDDLEEALAVFAKQKGPALVELLRLERDINSQPLQIVDRLLSREVEKLSPKQMPEPEELYGLVASENEAIQTAAFAMLHRVVPEQQQQNAVELLLDNQDARLPDELVSLLLDPPTLEQFTDEALAQFPVSVRGYLLSWKLIFDAYGASPFKVRIDFTEGLKTEDTLSPLLDFIFDVLGHSAGYPLKLDKEGITREQIRDYDIKLAEAEPEEKSMHWLMVHLFYLTLKYLPGLFRTWYQDCRSKQTKLAVETWTESFFSPLIIEDALDDVQAWADSKDFNSSDEAEITIKLSKKGKEVSAFYEIDEVEGSVAIKLPNSFPIEGVTVRGNRRVAVSERKWQSWMMTTQGVITFSNGNIIDGLQVFRRNLTGALQGHSECAICYSVISSDQRVPEKTCTTCSNLFHRLCLYKWFQTSNNNTCPLCRTPINFAGSSAQKRKQGGRRVA